VEVKLANYVLDDLKANYRDTTPADQSVGQLRTGEVKTKMEKVIADLKSIDKIRADETATFKSKLKTRTDSYEKELDKPAKRLSKANYEWSTASNQEQGKVDNAAYNLREARFPGVYNLEDAVSKAETAKTNAKNSMDTAINARVSAQSTLTDIENIPNEINSLKDNNNSLKSQNSSLFTQAVTYLATTKLSLAIDISSKQTEISNAVANGYDTSSLRSELSDLEERQNDLTYVAIQMAAYRDLGNVSTLFLSLSFVDQVVVNGFSSQYRSNTNQITQNNNSINEKDSYYRNNINNARSNVRNKTSIENEETSKYNNADTKHSTLSTQLESLMNNPIADTDSRVKTFFTTYNKALEHQDARVGDKAPLTKEKNAAQAVVDDINGRYNIDRHAFENNIQNSSDSTHNKAMQMIAGARKSL
jgi:hypothetical protein